MKIAFTTLACPDWGFERILDEAKRLGYRGVEIRGLDNEMRADRMPVFFMENMESTKKAFVDHGLMIAGFGSSVKFHDESGYEASLGEGRLTIDVCARMGIAGIRVLGDQIANGGGAAGGAGVGADAGRARAFDLICGGLRVLCEYARGKNVDILLEIHGDFNTLENVMPIIERVKDCPEFGILWDIGNSDISYGANWQEFYAGIKPLVRHLHIKDHIRDGENITYCPPGDGDVPVADIVKTLKRDGYDGWYSFEWEKKWHPELAGPEEVLPGYIAFMKKLLN